MQRTLTYTIPEESAHRRVEQYLRHLGYSARDLAALRKPGNFTTRNGSKVTLKAGLSSGDTLCVHIEETASSPHITPVPLPLSIVYEDEDLLIADKPAGMPTHPSKNNQENSLASALAWHYKSQGIPFVFRCITRLDKDTSGLVLAAKHCISGTLLSNLSKAHEIHRTYVGIAEGSVTPKEGTITAPLSRKNGSVIERTVDFENGQSAITHYRVIKEANGYSLVSFLLETGRTHQIRIHMKYLGFPLIGDYLYHPDKSLISRQALHARALQFIHPITGEEIDVISPLPDDMRQVLDLLDLVP